VQNLEQTLTDVQLFSPEFNHRHKSNVKYLTPQLSVKIFNIST